MSLSLTIVEFAKQQNKILLQICFELYGKSQDFPDLTPELSAYSSYIKNNLLKIVNVDVHKELKLIKSKLDATKRRWLKHVVQYYETNNASKYILAEENKLKSLLEISQELVSDKSQLENKIKSLYQQRMDTLNGWIESGLLHEFLYIDDLQVNQRKLILEQDTLFLLLQEAVNNPDLLNVAMEVESESFSSKGKYGGGQMPDSLISVDGIFRVSKPKDEQITIFDNEIAFTNETSEMKYTLSAPVLFRDQESDLIIDYSSERNYLTAYEQKVLVAILELGRKQIQSSNKIRFSINLVIDLLGISNGGKNYALIEKYMYNLFNFRHRVEYKTPDGESRILTFVIFQSIDRPKDEDKDDQGQKEWVVTLNSDLHNQILERNFVDVFAEELRELHSETAMVLLPFLASERLKSFKRISTRGRESYDGFRLIEKSGLGNNKPSKLIVKIEEALYELQQKSICIQNFRMKGTGKNSKFYIQYLEA